MIRRVNKELFSGAIDTRSGIIRDRGSRGGALATDHNFAGDYRRGEISILARARALAIIGRPAHN